MLTLMGVGMGEIAEKEETRACGDGGDPAFMCVTVTKGVGWMPRSFVPMKDVA